MQNAVYQLPVPGPGMEDQFEESLSKYLDSLISGDLKPIGRLSVVVVVMVTCSN